MRLPLIGLGTFILSFFLIQAVWGNPPTPIKKDELPPSILPVVNREYLPKLLQLIQEAEKSIEFIQLEFHYDPEVKKIQNALRDALARGIKVRGLLEDNISFNKTSAKYLNQFGIETRLDTPNKMLHNKLFIIDGRQVLLGSTNLSANSINNNNETNLYVESPKLGAFFADYFSQLWQDSNKEPRSDSVELGGVVKTVINRQHFPELLGLIQKSKTRVWVIMYGMSYNERYPGSHPNRLIETLIESAKKGVDVRVVLDKSDYNEGINKVNTETAKRLKKGGVKVHFDREDITTHAKLIVADNQVMVGSANWGYQALDIRNESSLITDDPVTVDFFVTYFMSMWEKGTYLIPTQKVSPTSVKEDS